MNENELEQHVDLVESLTKLFVEEYQVWSDNIAQYMGRFDDSESRKRLLQEMPPQVAKFVEGHTKEELQKLLIPCAIGHACAMIAVCAHVALHRKGTG